MSRIREETVTRHPCVGFEEDSLGETSQPILGDSVEVEGARVAHGGSSESPTDTDSTVESNLSLTFRRRAVESTPHDEWTVRGLRYEQVGIGVQWPLGTVINLARRTG